MNFVDMARINAERRAMNDEVSAGQIAFTSSIIVPTSSFIHGLVTGVRLGND